MVTHKRGFSFIELLIVVAIIAILAAVAIPNYYGVMENAQRLRDRTNARIVADAINVHQMLDSRVAVSDKFTQETPPYRIKRALLLASLWPKGEGFTTVEYPSDKELQLFEYIIIEDGVATIKDDEQQ